MSRGPVAYCVQPCAKQSRVCNTEAAARLSRCFRLMDVVVAHEDKSTAHDKAQEVQLRACVSGTRGLRFERSGRLSEMAPSRSFGKRVARHRDGSSFCCASSGESTTSSGPPAFVRSWLRPCRASLGSRSYKSTWVRMSRRWGVPRGSRLPGRDLALLCQAVLQALEGHVALKSLVLYSCVLGKVGL